jgi:hypothetical protein
LLTPVNLSEWKENCGPLPQYTFFSRWGIPLWLYIGKIKFADTAYQVWRNCQVLSEQTSELYDFLSATCPTYSTVIRIFHFSYLDPDYQTSGLTVTGLARVNCFINALFTFCLADLTVTMNIHGSFPGVNNMISCRKKVFVKAALRRYKDNLPP